jgi:5-methylcytosine-specific restriction endonuclease McrA
MRELARHSDEDLLMGVSNLVGSHRTITAELVAHLAEIEERRLHLVAGYSSMFDFCQRKLGMGEGEAFRRILAARLGRRFPVIFGLIATGRVNLSTLELLREWLTDENHEELLEVVACRSKREVQAILAARFPRSDRPSRLERTGTVEPLSATRFRVEFTAGAELVRKLERCLDLMSHVNPKRELAVVVERAVDLLLVELERTRVARVEHPRTKRRSGTATAQESNHERISAAVRREVYERDGRQCTYVAEDGRRCHARAFLELDHVVPRALGGSSEPENVRVRCRAHNQLWAEQVFGRKHVDERRRFRQKKSAPAHEREEREERGVREVLEMVRFALRDLGFRDDEARRAVAIVRARCDGKALAVETALREALRVATAASPMRDVA